MNQSLETEESWLEQIQTSTVVGICFLDAEGRLVQRIDNDPSLKEAIVEWQQDRVRQLRLFSQKPLRRMVSYPTEE